MKEALFAIGYLILLFAIAGTVLLFVDRVSEAFRRRRNPPEKLAEEWRQYQARILNPDWTFYEQHLKREVPPAIRRLFDDSDIVLSQASECCGDQIISRFGALDAVGLSETREWTGTDVVAIAYTLSGDPIYLRPGENESNAVFITYHDGGDTEEIAADSAAFVDSIRPVRVERQLP